MSEMETKTVPPLEARRTPRIPLNACANVDRTITLYVIASGSFLKIGVSENIEKRLEQMRALNPHDVRLLMRRTAPRYLGMEIEKRLHARFASFRHRGEWFVCDFQVVKQAVTEEMRHVPRLLKMDAEHLADVMRRHDERALSSIEEI